MTNKLAADLTRSTSECSAAGLVTLYFGFIVVTVLALGLGVIFHQGSSQYMQLKDQMTEHHYLARLIATQQSELTALRSEVQSVLRDKDHPVEMLER